MKKPIPPLHKMMGRNLKNIRRNACLSQSKLGEELGVSFQQIQKYENGINRLPAEHIYTLKHFLGVPYERFFHFPNAPETDDTQDKNTKLTEDFIRKLEKVNDQTLRAKALRILTILIE